MGKNFAYAMAELGVLDAGVVADTASYGVFCRAARCPAVWAARAATAPTTRPMRRSP